MVPSGIWGIGQRTILLLTGMAILVFLLQPSANIVAMFDNRFSNAPVPLFFDRIK